MIVYDERLSDIWIEGEVTNLVRAPSGHCYFSLTDAASALKCVLFRNKRGAEHLENGAKVIAQGGFSIYERRGDLQLIANLIQPEGVGELWLRLERLEQKLELEGLFDPSRKRPLPAFPKRIGVATSSSGAVWQDIQNIVARRWPLAELVLASALVQGVGAAESVAAAIVALSAMDDVDAIIVARGGGSLEDLMVFNEEAVARAVFASRHPVVSGVGHESDTTICDKVADVRAPTPSAAAELLVPDRAELIQRLRAMARGMDATISHALSMASSDADSLRSRLDRAAPDVDQLRVRVDDLLDDAEAGLSRRIELSRSKVDAFSSALGALSPRNTLRRGYAIVVDSASNSVLTDETDANPGQSIDITLHRGHVIAKVESTSSTRNGD